MSRQLLIDYLERQRARFTRNHQPLWPQLEEAVMVNPPSNQSFAKVVMIKVEAELAMMVLPFGYQVDVEALQEALGVEEVRLAQEREYCYRFPRCEPGAIPPFGHLYGFQTYMAPVFEQSQEITFYGGTHSEIIYMPLEEYLRLAHVIKVADGVIPTAAAVASALPLHALHI